jgi:hypothetical protein
VRKLFGLALLVVACRNTGGGAGGGGKSVDAPAAHDAPAGSAIDAPIINGDDGTPTRQPCSNHYGTALTEDFGRLDGTLVALVPPGTQGCNSDDTHMHLQIKMNDEIYDIAIDVGNSDGSDDVHTTTRELALPLWSEGWHTGSDILNDYPTDGVHSTDMPLETRVQVGSDIDADVATANHVSLFATGYGSDGAHLVHRNGGGHDGLLVTQPLSSPAHARLFSFSDQTF